MSFRYDKENLFKEFYIAKEKDISLSKKKTLEEKENDIHTNRIQFFKDHIELKKKNKSYYDNVDINFENLLKVYQSSDPRDVFYQTVFGMSYAAKKFAENAEHEKLGENADQ